MSMNQFALDKFKRRFDEIKKTLAVSFGTASADFQVSADDLADETDLCSSELASSMMMRLRNREALYVRKINEAIGRIQEGTFGECEECGDDIDLKRLEARPTTTLCISCKEDQERLEDVHIDGRKPKSLGNRLKLA
ncbi:MAG: TraR/DksA C4-type zinc finger protein [Oligoflexia bacterium]|nr:TraR/DksA C4-type zinc finger protein [Oligoflexia bacterium]